MKKKIFNLPNKITLARIFVTVLIVFILLFPFGMTGIDIPRLFINEKIIVDVRYLVAGVLFIIFYFDRTIKSAEQVEQKTKGTSRSGRTKMKIINPPFSKMRDVMCLIPGTSEMASSAFLMT